MKLNIPRIVEAPDDATHFVKVDDDISFYKMREIGVAGEHWFRWNGKQWNMVSHCKPNWIELIPEEWK